MGMWIEVSGNVHAFIDLWGVTDRAFLGGMYPVPKWRQQFGMHACGCLSCS